MLTRLKSRYEDFWVTALLAVLLAGLFLLFGFAELIHPDVPKGYLSVNTWMCIYFIIIGFALLIGVIIPYWGGILVCVCPIPLIVISHFHLGSVFFSIPFLLIGVRLFFAGRYLKVKKIHF
jgi:hypothetical protein